MLFTTSSMIFASHYIPICMYLPKTKKYLPWLFSWIHRSLYQLRHQSSLPFQPFNHSDLCYTKPLPFATSPAKKHQIKNRPIKTRAPSEQTYHACCLCSKHQNPNSKTSPAFTTNITLNPKAPLLPQLPNTNQTLLPLTPFSTSDNLFLFTIN